MTREDAIDLLDNLIGMVDDNHDSDYDTALKMAIKALEQEPMRDATPEERESVDAFIKSISKQTGIEFDEEQEQLDFVQPHKSIPVKLKVIEPSGNTVSRQAVLDLAKFDERKGLGNIIHAFDVEQLPSVKPLEKTGHCEDCKHFRKLPYHADTLGKCIHHTGFCPKGDWYCADFEPQERSDKE